MSAPVSTTSGPSNIPPFQPPIRSHPPPPSSKSNTKSSQKSNPPSTTSSSTSALPHSPETQRQIAEARIALEASMTNIGSSLDTSLKSRAQTLHSNSAALAKQEKDLLKETARLKKETERLGKVAGEGARKVKELGNVQNWAEVLERDFLVLGETIRLANGGRDEWSGSESGSEGSWETESEVGDILTKGVDGEGGSTTRKLDDDAGKEMDDKGKGKEGAALETQVQRTEQQLEFGGGSSTATVGSGSDPSSTSVHTENSTAS
ncbi:hypothetical protein LHYA1_G006470 [Lachnellula hyalina]|uniref:Biogenesis of lysosome-related organelles complex 1 subunit 1 n=1 Tax=Lachnellula hyalina TaxID=1316788 RepID=A0A8H8TY92_9HELO|nr:uncharacterized protein LHYA1_G006470 [Lachnellula hyalina]TVY25135.1 hypothetical protein LHYA1_G006470 [Lachnellula hyalina]